MSSVILKKDQKVSLEGIKGVTVKASIESAIKFCKENRLSDCDLTFNGFTFDIEATSKIEEKLSDYWGWRNKDGKLGVYHHTGKGLQFSCDIIVLAKSIDIATEMIKEELLNIGLGGNKIDITDYNMESGTIIYSDNGDY